MICPQCRSQDNARILYGYYPYIDKKLRHDLDNNKVILGGCAVSEDGPNVICNDCLHQWKKS